MYFFFFSSRRRHTRYWRDWSSDVCSSDLDFIYRQQGGIKRLADRFLPDLYGPCYLFFCLAYFLFKLSLLIGRHFLLCKQRQLVGVKRKVLLTHTAEHLLSKPIKRLFQGDRKSVV